MFKRNALVAALILSPTAWAVDDGAWNGSAELGTIFTSGNTDTQSINAGVAAKHKGDVWDSALRLSALTSKEDDVVSKETYSGLLQFDRNFTERSYLALVAEQERARFSGYTYQTVFSASYGHRIIQQDNLQFNAEVGPGVRRDKLEDTGEIQRDTIARLAANIDWTIREGVSFIENFTAELGADNSIYKSETGLQSQVAGNLATKITYNVKYVDKVPASSENTDTEFGITLVYGF
ncbi:MAG: DUF481 domain-containing protein [Oleibacter sp.]|nr:DUF481 domain-containing protein [Thalassolituus sp.]